MKGKNNFAEDLRSIEIEQGNQRIRIKNKFVKQTNGANIIRFIKSQRLKCVGHIVRMEDHEKYNGLETTGGKGYKEIQEITDGRPIG